MASTAKQAKGLKWLFWTGFYSAVLAFMSLFVAFASPYWIQSWRRVHSPLANTGLWQICLSGYIKPRDPTLSGYVGCWWIHTTVFHDISDSIMPPWFRMVQAFTIISLVMIVVAAVLVGLFRPEDTRNNLYGKLQHQLMYCNAALLLIPAAMIFIDSLVFAMKTKDPNWMPRPHLNYLSWSYGFNVLAGFFSAFAGICVTLIALILKDTRDKTDMPWQPKVEASKPVQSYPVRSYPQAPSEASERSYGTNSQVSQAYSGQHKPYQYYPTAAPIDRSKEPPRMTEKPYVAQYVPSSAPIQKSQPQHDYAPRKPYVAEYKPTKPPVESSYQAPPSRYANTPSYSQGYSVAVKRTPRTSNDDTKESDV